MKKKSILIAFLLFCTYSEEILAQAVLTKLNGDVIANPNLRVQKGIKINPLILKNVNALKLSGKTTSEIVKALKTDKVTAKDAFKSVKETSIPDAENIAALCFAGYKIEEVLDALVVDGYAAMEATGLLKNSTGCSFSQSEILLHIKHAYRIDLGNMAPIINTYYTTNTYEIVRIFSELVPFVDQGIYAIAQNRYANNAAEVCRLTKGRYINFDNAHLVEVLRKLLSSPYGRGENRDQNMVDALLVMDATPIRILETFKVYYNSTDVRTATYLASIAKYLKFSREETATFLRRYSYTATLVLDALQAVYG